MKNVLVIVAITSVFGLEAQSISSQVIGAQGGSLTHPNVGMDFTVGECVIQTVVAGPVIVTQGFHQTNVGLSGLEEVEENASLFVYPNPAEDQLTISLGPTGENAEDVRIEIYALNGQQVYRETISTGWSQESVQLDVSRLNSGHYQIHLVKSNGSIHHTKFVKT